MADADIFGRQPLEIGGALAAEMITVTFGSTEADDAKSNKGMLIQNVRISYRQPISRLFGLESRVVWYVVGRPSGGLVAAHIVADGVLMANLYKQYGDICKLTNGGTNEWVIGVAKYAACDGGVAGASAAAIRLGNIVIHSLDLDMSVNQGNYTMTDTFNAEFTKLTI